MLRDTLVSARTLNRRAYLSQMGVMFFVLQVLLGTTDEKGGMREEENFIVFCCKVREVTNAATRD